MSRFENALKKATNLSLNSSVLKAAREMGMNISQTVDELLAAEVRRRYWLKWNEDNKEEIDHYNARIAFEGLPLAQNCKVESLSRCVSQSNLWSADERLKSYVYRIEAASGA